MYSVDYIRTLVGEGILIHETPYIDDKQHGMEKEYYEENGKIRSEVEYKNGKLEGITKGYYKNGQLAYSATYKDDKRHGVEKWYYDDGALLRESAYINGEKNGIEKTYYRNGNLSSQANYENGKRVGITKTYYSNGNLLSEREYKKDEIETKYYNEKGEIGLEVILLYPLSFYHGLKFSVYKNGKVLTKDEQKDIIRISNIFSDFSHVISF